MTYKNVDRLTVSLLHRCCAMLMYVENIKTRICRETFKMLVDSFSFHLRMFKRQCIRSFWFCKHVRKSQKTAAS